MEPAQIKSSSIKRREAQAADIHRDTTSCNIADLARIMRARQCQPNTTDAHLAEKAAHLLPEAVLLL